MRTILPLAVTMALLACGPAEPDRPSAEDEARFERIDAMLDEEAARTAQEKGAAPEDATPSQD